MARAEDAGLQARLAVEERGRTCGASRSPAWRCCPPRCEHVVDQAARIDLVAHRPEQRHGLARRGAAAAAAPTARARSLRAARPRVSAAAARQRQRAQLGFGGRWILACGRRLLDAPSRSGLGRREARSRLGRWSFRSREPTDVGGRRVSGPTGPARDSSLEIDKAPRIVLLTNRAATRRRDIGCARAAPGKHAFCQARLPRAGGDGASPACDRRGAETMTSRYAEIYESWRRDPARLLGRSAAAEIDWFKPWDKVFDPTLGVYGRWFVGAECNTCWNCVDRHAAKRPDADRDHLRQPGHRHEAAHQLRRAARRGAGARRRAAGPRRRQGRPRHHLHADDPGGGDLRHARLRPARRGPFRRVRRLRRAGARRPASTTPRPKLIISASCGIEPGRIVAYKPLLDAAIARAAHKPRRLPDRAARGARAASSSPAATTTTPRRWRARARPHGRMRAAHGHRPALHPLHLRHDRPAEGRRARQWRPHGRAEMVDVGDLRHRSRRDVLGRLRRRLGGRPFLHRLRAAAARLHDACSTRASRSARPTPAPSGASSPSTSVAALFTAPTAFRAIKKEDPDGSFIRKLRPRKIPHAVPRRRARRPRHDPMGGAASRRAGHRPLVADGDRLVDLRQPGRARPAAGEIRLARRADARLRPARPRRCRQAGRRPARSATSS